MEELKNHLSIMVSVHPETTGSFDVSMICNLYNKSYFQVSQQLKDWTSSLTHVSICIDNGILYFAKKDNLMTNEYSRHILGMFELMNQ